MAKYPVSPSGGLYIYMNILEVWGAPCPSLYALTEGWGGPFGPLGPLSLLLSSFKLRYKHLKI